MSKRVPTEEEILLWREINRTTDIHREEPPLAITATALREEVSAPLPTAPTVTTKKPITALAALTPREAKKRRNLYPVDATLDLHGYSRVEAYTLVRAFVARHGGMGHRHVVIITGKGRGGEMGVLRTELPHWLNEPELRRTITAFFHADARSGGHGVMHVILKLRS